MINNYLVFYKLNIDQDIILLIKNSKIEII